MDPNAPLVVAQGTLITSAALSLGASLYGAIKGLPIGPLATSTAVNSGITSATFFSIREYLVGPILLSTISYSQFARRRQELERSKEVKDAPSRPLSWWDMRTHKVPDTGISGALTGGVLNAWKRGRVGILPGMVTGSIVCTLLQFAYNEIGVIRVKYVSQTFKDATKPSSPHRTKADVPQESTVPQTPPIAFSDRVFDWFGFRKVSDDEYLAKLIQQRDGHLRRIAELEKELEGSEDIPKS